MENPKYNAAPSLQELQSRVLSLATMLANEIHPDQIGRTFHADDSLDEDFGFDSLSRVELLHRIETDLGLVLSENALFRTNTIGELVQALITASPAYKPHQEIKARLKPLAIVPEVEPIEATTLMEALLWQTTRNGDRQHATLIREDGHEYGITYANLLNRSLEISSALQNLGVENEDRVSLMLPTGTEYLASFFGILFAGAVPVPIYPPVNLLQMADHLKRQAGILQNCGAKILLVPLEWKHSAKGVTFVLRSFCPGLQQIIATEDLQFVASPSPVKKTSASLALIQYTSGSTGNPKGVALTHNNLLANIRAMGKVIHGNANDIFVSWLPLYHDMGLIGAWLGSLYYGARLILMSPFFFLSKPERWLWALHRHRGTLTTAPNFAYELCLKRISPTGMEGLDLSTVRAFLNGAEPVSAATLKAFAEKFEPFGLRKNALAPVYGLAECAVGLTFPPAPRLPLLDVISRDTFQRTAQGIPAKPSESSLTIVACGQPLPEHEVRIVDEHSKEVPERTEGRIQFRGPSATQGYFNNSSENKLLFEGGWLNTGDLGYRAQGDLYVTGRSKDVVIRAGRKIQPHEIEEAVGNLPGVRKGCVVAFGTKDPKIGTERLVIAAETHQRGEQEQKKILGLINGIVTELVATTPDEILLVPPHTLLKTSSGKIRRYACRDSYERGRLRTLRSPQWYQIARLMLLAIKSKWVTFSKKIREKAYAIYCFGIATLVLTPIWFGVVFSCNKSEARKKAKYGASLLARLTGISIEVNGLENLPLTPAILIVNHSSYLDVFVLTAVLPPRYAFIGKAELKNSFFLHSFLVHLGTLYVDRFLQESGHPEVQKMIEKIRDDDSLIVFPEGTFTRKPGLLPFRTGAFLAATKTGVPVVPVSMTGTREILGAETIWLHRGGKIGVTIGRPLPAENSSKKEDAWREALRIRDQARRQILSTTGTPDLSSERKIFILPKKIPSEKNLMEVSE